jgi:hypothetical protein
MAVLTNLIMADSLAQLTIVSIVNTWVNSVTKRLTITASNALLNPTIVNPENAYTFEDQ